jgi:serine/threonine-protein kinase
MVSVDGRVKVLDFGLATAPAKAGALGTGVDRPGSSPADQLTIASPQITTPGMIVGTMPYMSPEQVEGKVLDDRSDLFSLGVMFYEMLTGMRPFAGESPPQLMSSILRDAPRDINEIRGDVPDALGRLVARCLEKRPDERVQTARDVYNELRHLQRSADSGPLRRASSGTATAAVSAESLRMVVKPFAAQGGRDAEALASGLTDDITLGLARFPYLAVATRASTNPERSGRAGIAASYVVEGSVRMSADRVRIGAQLIDTEQGVHLWTDTYNRDLAATDVLTLQDDVVDRVVATVGDVHGVLMQSMTRSLRATPTRDAPLDELHLRYWRYHRQHAPDDRCAQDVLEALIAREPNRATAWAALAQRIAKVAFGSTSAPNRYAAHGRRSRARSISRPPTSTRGRRWRSPASSSTTATASSMRSTVRWHSTPATRALRPCWAPCSLTWGSTSVGCRSRPARWTSTRSTRGGITSRIS